MDFQLNNLEVDLFLPIRKPRVRYFGVAAISRGCLLANITHMRSSDRYYLVEIELPRVQFHDGEVECTVNSDGMVIIEGELIRAAMCSDFRLLKKRKPAQLCPTDKWGMLFRLPGPVDWWTMSVVFTSQTTMEILVTKTRHVAAAVMVGSPPLSPDPISFAPPEDNGLNNRSN